jgi:hypothetical protein
MATKLDKLLERIDPVNTLDRYEARVYAAFNSFPIPRDGMPTEAEFDDLLGRLEFHLLTVQQDSTRPYPAQDHDFWCGQMHARLRQLYGQRGERVAWEMARTGIDGGLYGVLKALVDHFARQWAERIIASEIANYYQALTVDERLAAPGEYLAKFRHLLPADIRHGLDHRLAGAFTSVLEQHPRLIQQIHQRNR